MDLAGLAAAEGDAAGAAVLGVDEDEAGAGVDDVAAIHIEMGAGGLEDAAPIGVGERRSGGEPDVTVAGKVFRANGEMEALGLKGQTGEFARELDVERVAVGVGW